MNGSIDYSLVSEAPGVRVSAQGISMIETRYALAADLARGREVLEVGCGAGMGLGWIARNAKRTVGGDYTAKLLTAARQHYGRRVPLVRLDAHALPFTNESFDLVILYEAMYYLERARDFLAEARRILRPSGVLVICTANRESYGFNPSPFSSRYWSAAELERLLSDEGFRVQLRAGFADKPHNGRTSAKQRLKHLAARLHLIPRTMKGKELLKRVFEGSLHELPRELDGERAQLQTLVPVTAEDELAPFKVIYAIAALPGASPGASK